MQKPPTVAGLKVCHEAIVQEKTRNVTLVNCFRKLHFASFPTEPTNFTVCVVLTDGRGEGLLTLTLTSLNDLDDVIMRTWRIALTDPLKEVWFLLPVPGYVFPNPGKYEVAVAIDNERAAQTTFHVLSWEDQVMDNEKKKPQLIVIDAATEVVILDESTGETDRTRRPITGARLQQLKERLAREAELRKLMEENNKQNGNEPPQS